MGGRTALWRAGLAYRLLYHETPGPGQTVSAFGLVLFQNGNGFLPAPVVGGAPGVSRRDANSPPFIEHLRRDWGRMQKSVCPHKDVGKRPPSAPSYRLGHGVWKSLAEARFQASPVTLASSLVARWPESQDTEPLRGPGLRDAYRGVKDEREGFGALERQLGRHAHPWTQ